MEMDLYHREALWDFRNSKNLLRTLTTVSRTPHLRDGMASFRVLFKPPGYGLDSLMSSPSKKPGNVMRLLGVFSLGEFGTGAVDERRFFSRLTALVPASR